MTRGKGVSAHWIKVRKDRDDLSLEQCHVRYTYEEDRGEDERRQLSGGEDAGTSRRQLERQIRIGVMTTHMK